MNWLKSRLGLSLTALTLLACGAIAYAQGAIDPKGKPEGAHAGSVERYSLWHDGTGWHLMTSTAGHEHHFRGWIKAEGGKFVGMHGEELEKRGPQADHWKLGPKKHEVTFDFSTKGGEDELMWRVEGNAPELEFNLEIGEKDPKFVPDRVFIGASGAHPASGPFKLPAHPGK
jgi:hypothetical protein